MPNHFHFEFKIKNAEILPKAMEDITLAYTNHHHRKYDPVGQWWQGKEVW
jgi:hypothetical protein